MAVIVEIDPIKKKNPRGDPTVGIEPPTSGHGGWSVATKLQNPELAPEALSELLNSRNGTSIKLDIYPLFAAPLWMGNVWNKESASARLLQTFRSTRPEVMLLIAPMPSLHA